MKRVYFVAVTSDIASFEEVVGYATKEQALIGLAICLESFKKHIADMGYDDVEKGCGDDWFTLNYNGGDNFYHGEIKCGVMFEEGEKPTPLRAYKVTITKTVLAYGEDDAVEVAKGDEDYEYDDEEKITAELVG